MRPFSRNSTRGAGLVILILMVLALGLISGMLAISAKYLKDQQNIATTQTKLFALSVAISAVNNDSLDVDARDYETDVGTLPTSLNDLLTMPSGVSACALDPVGQDYTGWCGPYWAGSYSGENVFSDGWGNTIVYNKSGRSIRSYGPNQVDDSGGGDDIVQTF